MTMADHVQAARRAGSCSAGLIEARWAGIAAEKESYPDCPFAEGETELRRWFDAGRDIARRRARQLSLGIGPSSGRHGGSTSAAHGVVDDERGGWL